MRKNSNFIKTFVMFFAMIITLVLVSCGSKAVMINITWDIPAEAKVSVSGQENLPKELEEGSTLVFSVTPDNGYELSSVKVNGKKVREASGNYSIEINEEKTIKVEVKKTVTGLIVESKPTKLNYYAGESLDTTGMVVKAKYYDGTTQIIEMGANGYALSPSTFEGGETEVSIMFGGFVEKIKLEKRVEFKVEIDPDGGVISDEYLNDLASRNLNGYKVSEEGVITFTYFDELTKPIKLPNKDQISKKDHVFLGWSENAELSNHNKISLKTKAGWQGELVSIEKVDLVVENDIPYLILEGKFKLANEVYLKLYEGNVQSGFKGDTYKNEGGYGSAFNAKFDLRKLVEARQENGETFEGKWMDITFYAAIGENEVKMDVFVGEDSNVTVDMSKKVDTSNETFTFAEWNKELKVYYNVKHYIYTLDMVEKDGETFIVINGECNTSYANQTVEISWEFDSPDQPVITAPIDENGRFMVMMNVKDFNTSRQGFAHITIYKDQIDNPSFGSKTTNLAISQCRTNLDPVSIAGTDIHHAVKFETKDGMSYYVGHAWDGLMFMAKDEKIKYTGVDLELIDGAVYYVVSGTFKNLSANELIFYIDLEHMNPIDGHPWGEKVIDKTLLENIIIDNENNTFKVMLNATATCEESFKASQEDIWALIVHFGLDSNYGDLKEGSAASTIINLNGIEYSLLKSEDTWNITLLVLKTTTAENGIVKGN